MGKILQSDREELARERVMHGSHLAADTVLFILSPLSLAVDDKNKPRGGGTPALIEKVVGGNDDGNRRQKRCFSLEEGVVLHR